MSRRLRSQQLIETLSKPGSERLVFMHEINVRERRLTCLFFNS
jgi:hypothetical protein